ncbi:MAG: ATP-binding cassette domain-containing protein, partial [Treponemataceae bacterium]|nr:ATP-binding cassette domain-containing protein [Treponemataceae bacterium]
IVASLKDVTKWYVKDRNVIHNLHLTIECGERIVVAGRNGAGKSTLLRIIAGVDKNFEGEVVLGAGVKIGYFSQDSAETFAGHISILDYMEQNAPMELIPRIRDMLGAFLFHGDDVFKSLDMLSGGEKSRIALLQLLMRSNNFLILDEPTNHLDIHSKDVLLQALKDFKGTVIFVSHDRGFMEDLSTKVLELSNGCHREFYGDYKYYQERLEAEERGDIPSSQVERQTNAKNNAGQVKNADESFKGKKSKGALNYEEVKKFEAAKRKAEKELKKVEDEIARLESEKKTLETKLSLPEIYSNGEKARQVQTEIHKIDSSIEDLNIVWEKAMQEVEKYAE